MTQSSIREYVEAVRERYFLVSKKDKGKILDGFTKVTDRHRKAVIRLIRHGGCTRIGKKRVRPGQYGPAVVGALRLAWEATDRLCSKRLQPFLPELVNILRRQGEASMSAEVEARLCQISSSTIDRLLRALAAAWRTPSF